MKIFNWMQNKLNGKHGSKKSTVGSSNCFPMQEAIKEEFSDWPHGLLSIGTFGNKQMVEDSDGFDSSEFSNSSNSNSSRNLSENSISSREFSNFTEEEVGELQKELTKLLALKTVPNLCHLGEEEKSNLQSLDEFLNCPSSLQVDRRNCEGFCDDSDGEGGEFLSRSGSVVLSKGKDVSMDAKAAIPRKSVSFLLKKMFVCGSRFAPARSLRHPIPESRMEKLLRKLLRRQMVPQNAGTTAAKKYLVHKHARNKGAEDPAEEKASDGCKWVKTDSEFIVLEM